MNGVVAVPEFNVKIYTTQIKCMLQLNAYGIAKILGYNSLTQIYIPSPKKLALWNSINKYLLCGKDPSKMPKGLYICKLYFPLSLLIWRFDNPIIGIATPLNEIDVEYIMAHYLGYN